MATALKHRAKTAAPPRTAAPPKTAAPPPVTAESALAPAPAALSFPGLSFGPIESAPLPEFKTSLVPAEAADNSLIVYLAAAGAALFFLLRKA